MFGYVRPLLEELPQAEQERFRRLYCGLCQTLKERYGFFAQWILNFDFTFLAALLQTEDSGRDCRCIANPCRKRRVICPDPALELAADGSVILTYWQLQDKIGDEAFFKGLGARTAAGLLQEAYRKASRLRPDFDGCVREQLQALHALEAQGCSSLDQTADCFAKILQGAVRDFPYNARRRVLEELLYHMGRWIYLIDAVDDLEKDAAHGQYNPICCHYGVKRLDREQRQELMITLQHSLNLMSSAYALEDFGPWSPLLENILYRSLFAVSKAVFDGEFHRRLRMPQHKKRENSNTKESKPANREE